MCSLHQQLDKNHDGKVTHAELKTLLLGIHLQADGALRCCLFFLYENLFCCRPHLQASAGEEVDQMSSVCKEKRVCFFYIKPLLLGLEHTPHNNLHLHSLSTLSLVYNLHHRHHHHRHHFTTAIITTTVTTSAFTPPPPSPSSQPPSPPPPSHLHLHRHHHNHRACNDRHHLRLHTWPEIEPNKQLMMMRVFDFRVFDLGVLFVMGSEVEVVAEQWRSSVGGGGGGGAVAEQWRSGGGGGGGAVAEQCRRWRWCQKEGADKEQQLPLIPKKKNFNDDGLIWEYLKALALVLSGTVVTALIALPLIMNVSGFATDANIPSFLIPYVIIPCAINIPRLLSTINSAGHKTQRAIYSGVFMSNMSSLTTFLLTVYIRDLPWDVSAEVLVVLIICGVMGIFTGTRTIFPLWTGYVGYMLYPTSLLMLYLFTNVWGWP
ncbi:putative EF-hand domain pair protein CML [Helianthus annuus]|nr:putative EF-hand domain pair protein CML [Helianthus annuus]